MKLQALRNETYQEYETLCLSAGVVCGAPFGWTLKPQEAERLPFTNTTFKDAIRQQFGDLRRKSTWKAAAIHYTAKGIAQGVDRGELEPYQLVCYMALPQHLSSPVRDAYGPEVIEALLSYPEAAAKIRAGLEQLVQEQPDIAKEFVETYSGAIAPQVYWT